jgi:dTDP-4-dehydrorhamnose 3,5-epimerase
MKVISSDIKDLFIIEPSIYVDQRGYFLESWNQQQFNQAINQEITFVLDNHSHSGKGVLRGLHYQLKHPQGKLVRVVLGNVLDVAVDLRRSSPTFGSHVTVELTAENHRQLWIPPGCAHGFVVLSENADFLYKTTKLYVPEDEYCIRYDDPDLKIDWRINGIHPILSKKDQEGVLFKSAEYYP